MVFETYLGVRDRELALVAVALGVAGPRDDFALAARAGIEGIRDLLDRVGQRRTLAAQGLGTGAFETIAQDAIDDVAINNSPRLPSKNDVLGILAAGIACDEANCSRRRLNSVGLQSSIAVWRVGLCAVISNEKSLVVGRVRLLVLLHLARSLEPLVVGVFRLEDDEVSRAKILPHDYRRDCYRDLDWAAGVSKRSRP
jgi:hypothetical protein